MFGEIWQRLAFLAENSGLTQGEIAERVGVSAASVSNWFSGSKPPSRANIEKLNGLFGLGGSTWIESGKGEVPIPRPEVFRGAHLNATGWGFRPAPEDKGRDYGNANVWAFDPTISVMVRDIVQNCRDARAPGEPLVEVVFKIIRLRGESLERFKEAVKWSQLHEHLRASAEIDQRLGRLIKHNLQILEKDRELLLLVVEDRGTVGLTGDEYGVGHFAALVRNSLDSNKGDTAGGAFGLGKAVLWRMSAFSLVLFGSNLSVPENGKSMFRMLGRCDLPWHVLKASGEEFAGPGWFGDVSGGAAVSFWDNPVLLDDLYVPRTSGSGASAAIVGFHDPSCDDEKSRDPMELATKIKSAAAEWFWPDMALGNLRVVVEIHEGKQRKSGGEVVTEDFQPEFVDAISKWINDETVEKFEKAGDVVAVPVALNYPERRAEPAHPANTHQAVLLVRYLGEEAGQRENSHKDELALIRGVGMVVQYVSLKGIRLGALPCHACLLAGLAAVKPKAVAVSQHREAERFLRTSEPPNHDRWTSTPDLTSEYCRPTKKAIDDLISSAKRAVADIVKPSMSDLDDGPNALKELLKIGDESEPPVQKPSVIRPSGKVLDDGSWSVAARIRVKPTEFGWRVRPVVFFDVEGGARIQVLWRAVKPGRKCREEDGFLVIEPNTREAEFEGITDPASHPIDAANSCVIIDVRDSQNLEA